MTRAAILTAMIPEMRPLAKALGLRRVESPDFPIYRGTYAAVDVVGAVTSIGTAPADRVTRALLDTHDVDHVLMVGVAGAVDPTLDVGDLVVPETVTDDASGTAFSPARFAGPSPRGTLLTTDVLYNKPEDVAGLIARDVVALDMETAAVAAVCEARGCPWSVYRAISDRAGDADLDTEVVALSNPDGSPDARAVLRFATRHPRRLPHLVDLARGLQRANRTACTVAAAALRDL